MIFRRILTLMLVVYVSGSAVIEAAGTEPQQEPIVTAAPPPAGFLPVVSRDDQGRVSVRAVRLTEPMVMDGSLDESIYRTVPPITELFQQVPDEGAPAT